MNPIETKTVLDKKSAIGKRISVQQEVDAVGIDTKTKNAKNKARSVSKNMCIPTYKEANTPPIMAPPPASSTGSSPTKEKVSQTYSSKHFDHQKKLTPSEFNYLMNEVKDLSNFHGFVCHEDLPMLLPKIGDWLIRLSIYPPPPQPPNYKKNKDFGELRHKDKSMRCVVVTVNCKDPPHPPRLRNLIVSMKKQSHFSFGCGHSFPKFSDLLNFHQQSLCAIKDHFDFILKHKIPKLGWMYRHEDVQLLEHRLGEGQFGEVREGRLILQKVPSTVAVNVAVKMLKNAKEGVTREQIHELLHEARMMRILKHPNVLRTHGIAVLSDPPMLMTELCTGGALREYLREHKTTVTLMEKLKFVLGASRGVEYIHSQKVIHRDLAVRNIFLTKNLTPKVSDFGLARQTERYEMREQCKMPVRYMAPESIESFIFTPKTDVFSFGCVIWEIYENGQQPFDGKTQKEIKLHLKNREFLKICESAPIEMQKICANSIFVADPENRCSMTPIVKLCETLLKMGKSHEK